MQGFNPASIFDMNTVKFYFTGSKLCDRQIALFREYGMTTAYDFMRCWDGGATFITCDYGNKHWIDFSSVLEFSPNGDLISTDLWNESQKFINYKNGDIVSTTRTNEICGCGLTCDIIEFSDRLRAFSFAERLYSLDEASIIVQTLFDTKCHVRFGVGEKELVVKIASRQEITASAKEKIISCFKRKSSGRVIVTSESVFPERKASRIYKLEENLVHFEEL
jgi:hypothetical protein